MTSTTDNPFAGASGRVHDAGSAIWETMEQIKSSIERHLPPMRMGRGDVRQAVLVLLAERPMHGYQIIHEIEERSGGSWKPSPGSVYPTLQLLADEGLISAEEQNGRKTYSLTEAGREASAAGSEQAPWEQSSSRPGARHTALRKAAVDLAGATTQFGRSATDEQIAQAVTVLEDARRKLYSILAAD